MKSLNRKETREQTETVNVWVLADRKKMMNRVKHAKGANTARVMKRRREMGKSILVIDTPNNCASCQMSNTNLYDMSKGGIYCQLNVRQDIPWENVRNSRPDWCPLQELPEKKEITDDNLSLSVDIVWNKAWNACIDKILRGGGEQE